MAKLSGAEMYKFKFLPKENKNMQEQERERVKECKYCGKFKRYYTKGASKFERADCGWCRSKKEAVKNNGSCEEWSPGGARAYVSRRAATRTLNEILEELSQLRQIFEESGEK